MTHIHTDYQARAEARRRKHNLIGDAIVFLIAFTIVLLGLKSALFAAIVAALLVAAGYGRR